MTATSLPAIFMRGGTSKAVVLRADVLPQDPAARDALFLQIMGSPDPYGRQLNGMGGGLSSLSKICILAPPTRPDADIDYTFAQVPVNGGGVDYSGNCGNMSSAMGPAAIELGLIAPPADGPMQVRIHNTNTAKIIIAHFPVKSGRLDPQGDFQIDGVSGQAAAIRLDFVSPGGAKTGKLLPTGAAQDRLSLPDGTEVTVSCIDAANPCVFIEAASLGLTGTELPPDLDANRPVMARLEMIRQAASVAMGLAPDLATAAGLASVPKVAMIAPPQDTLLLSGEVLPAARQSIVIRMLSMQQAHRATPVTGAICLAVAARLHGTLAHKLLARADETIEIAHPSGILTVDAVLTAPEDPALAVAQSGAVFRTARLLFKGEVSV